MRKLCLVAMVFLFSGGGLFAQAPTVGIDAIVTGTPAPYIWPTTKINQKLTSSVTWSNIPYVDPYATVRVCFIFFRVECQQKDGDQWKTKTQYDSPVYAQPADTKGFSIENLPDAPFFLGRQTARLKVKLTYMHLVFDYTNDPPTATIWADVIESVSDTFEVITP